MKPLSKEKAIEGIRYLDRTFNPQSGIAFFNNKRKTHRDYKWDYLNPLEARRASAKLTRDGIVHVLRICNSRFSDRSYAQIRLAVKLDFSLTAARKRPRKKKLTPRQQWRADLRDLRRYTKRLKFGAPFHRQALADALRAFYSFL